VVPPSWQEIGLPAVSVHAEWLATAPNQVWSWDITKLLGPAKWTYFHLYVILDIFTRYNHPDGPILPFPHLGAERAPRRLGGTD
jgi:hypothetical protein